MDSTAQPRLDRGQNEQNQSSQVTPPTVLPVQSTQPPPPPPPPEPSQTAFQPPAPPVPATSGIQKEHDLGGGAQKDEALIAPSEPHPEIPLDLKEIGVEAVHELPQLTLEDKKSGILPSPQSLPVLTQLTPEDNLPLSKEKAHQILKFHKKVSDSVTWLAILVLKHVKKMHEKLK